MFIGKMELLSVCTGTDSHRNRSTDGLLGWKNKNNSLISNSMLGKVHGRS